jgi:predicted phosphate transport protein (TIGR00153 family)
MRASIRSIPEARMLGWFHKLLPREEKFFELFVQHSETVVAGAEALRALLDGGEAVPRHYQTIMDREQDADNVTREVLITVRRTFITPFDRSDIKDLITSMDNAIDQMQKTAKGVMLYDQRSFTPCMREMGDTIVQCAKLVREAMPRLRSINTEATRLSEISQEISTLEGKADDLHDQGVRDLFLASVQGSAMTFFTGNEVYDHLEKVVDRFDDVANRIHGIVIDHA